MNPYRTNQNQYRIQAMKRNRLAEHQAEARRHYDAERAAGIPRIRPVNVVITDEMLAKMGANA